MSGVEAAYPDAYVLTATKAKYFHSRGYLCSGQGCYVCNNTDWRVWTRNLLMRQGLEVSKHEATDNAVVVRGKCVGYGCTAHIWEGLTGKPGRHSCRERRGHSD